MAFRMSGPTQQAPYRYVGNRMRPKPAPAPYTPPVAAPVAAPGPGTGGIPGRGALGGGGNNSDLDGNYDAMMARIQAGQSGAGFYHGQPITGPTPDAPGAVAGYNGQPQGGQPYRPAGPNDNLGLNGHANGTYGGYAHGGVVEPDGYQFDNPIRQIPKGQVSYGRKKGSLHRSGYFADGGAVGDEGNTGDDLSEALAIVKDVENHRRRQHGLLDGEPESENVDDRREEGGLLRPPGRLGEARNLDGALGGANNQRTLMGTSPVRGDLEDTGVRNKAPLGFADGGSVDDADEMLTQGDQMENPVNTDNMEMWSPDRSSFGPSQDEGYYNPREPDKAPRVMQYLQGADASHPDVAKQYEAKVDPDGTRDEGERKVLAVAAAAQDDGPDAAAALSASYRQKYDAYRGMAAGALAHGDLDKAAEAATKAYPNVLDGADVKFTRQGNGFTATVTKPGKDPESFPLSTNQFDEFVKGNAGQYDHVTDLGADVLLKDLSQSGGGAIPVPGAENTPMPAAAAAAGSPAPLDQWIDDQGIQRGGNPADHPEGKRTGTPVAARPVPKFNNPYRDMGISDQVAQRGMARFPMVSQNGQRLEYMQKLEDSQVKAENEQLKATENARSRIESSQALAGARRYGAEQGVVREGVRQEGQNRVAETRAAAYTAVNNLKSGVRSEGDKLKAQVALQKLAADSTNAQAKNTALLLGKEIMNIPLGSKLPPAHQKMLDQLINPPAPALAAGQAPQPQGQQSGGARVQGKNGEWYVQKSDGKFYREK